MINRCPPKGRHDTEERYIDTYFHNPVRHFLNTFPGVMIEPRDKSRHYGNTPFMDRRDRCFVVLDLILPFMPFRPAFLFAVLTPHVYTTPPPTPHPTHSFSLV